MNKKGKIFCIEGSDSSGKETQTIETVKNLKEKGFDVLLMSYPNYKGNGSKPVVMYLNNELGSSANSLNAYQGSVLYATDRLTSYLSEWKDFYDNGGIIIMDRYTSSNIIHQASKIKNKTEKLEFIDYWLDFEHNKLEIPKPDKIFFLDMPFEYSQILIKDRKNKINGESKKDIHERDTDFLIQSYNNAKELTNMLNWQTIKCIKDSTSNIEKSNILSKEKINEQIINIILKDIL